MAIATSAPIKRAMVQALRASTPLTTAIAGGIHEGLAPTKIKYPFIVYQLVAAPYMYTSDAVLLKTLIDVYVFAENPVDANNIDALINAALTEAEPVVDEQTTLLCRRVSDLPTGPDTDSEGRRIYQVGGSYSIWTAQA